MVFDKLKGRVYSSFSSLKKPLKSFKLFFGYSALIYQLYLYKSYIFFYPIFYIFYKVSLNFQSVSPSI